MQWRAFPCVRRVSYECRRASSLRSSPGILTMSARRASRGTEQMSDGFFLRISSGALSISPSQYVLYV
jgi:hypothetical protein